MNTETMDTLAGLAGPYLRRRAVNFTEAAGKLGIVGLEVGMSVEKVIVMVPHETALAEYGGGIAGSSAWIEHTAMDMGGGFE